ncbi:hypothetical protein DFA_11980 [Cavenderia fasciculata]|uniref:Peptidoglycan binding-like domain-containing protein n=1 Tax=Cavenderia fasciculata TaxID=261658 RepID=F4QF57_CACFS|nr:uncharacterized protein DFA_11980 [Cavenderia fasciculata]EGG14211.1 hypothetical protein DFA_11980 [Cavenderia fasciculata]|eukprot:XP_004350919.1 hypothetical protein DFA_11980 [Cavenderia fasciculata]
MTHLTKIVVLVISLLLGLTVSQSTTYPCPFYRSLSLASPVVSGDDVIILQGLLARSVPDLPISGIFDEFTEVCLMKYQSMYNIAITGILDVNTANSILLTNGDDGYTDNGQIPPGFKYKVHVPVYRNRSIETTATLYDDQLNVLHSFTVRTEGQLNTDGSAMNQFCGDGATPTGLMTFDLNSAEPDPAAFGPYPVNRAVQGIAGNAFLLISNVRDGILMHTGQWTGWNPSMPMPNSHGCVHGHPEDIDTVWNILTSNLNVYVRNNTFGALPYLYQPQGVLSIELID